MTTLLYVAVTIFAVIVITMVCDLPTRPYHYKHIGFGVYAYKFKHEIYWGRRRDMSGKLYLWLGKYRLSYK